MCWPSITCINGLTCTRHVHKCAIVLHVLVNILYFSTLMCQNTTVHINSARIVYKLFEDVFVVSVHTYITPEWLMLNFFPVYLIRTIIFKTVYVAMHTEIDTLIMNCCIYTLDYRKFSCMHNTIL